MKVLLTGFEPFGGETVNPSAEVVHASAAGIPATDGDPRRRNLREPALS